MGHMVAERWNILPGNSLWARLLYFMALGTVFTLAMLGVLGYLAVRQALDRTLEERRVLARVTAGRVEGVVEQNLQYLASFAQSSINLEDVSPETLRTALRDLFFQSIFDDRVFMLDSGGHVWLSEPQESPQQAEDFSQLPFFRQAAGEKRMAVSPVYFREPGHRPVVTAVVPQRDRTGNLVGWVGGSIDLTGLTFTRMLEPGTLGQSGYVEVVDAKGVVLATTRPNLLLSESDHGQVLAGLILAKESAVRTCHSCHVAQGPAQRETEVMAFVPLSSIAWGVAIRQSEEEALAPARELRQRFFLFGGLLLLLNPVLAYGISRGVVAPIRTLTRSARRLASGELDAPIPPLGKDEVGILGASLETMRRRLKESLEAIQDWNRLLEKRIVERTKRLEESQADRDRLLRRLISSQEEERKRIARELHDEVSQNIATLAMALDRVAGQESAKEPGLSERLGELKALAVRTLDEIRRMILDLRPSILDDLGLVPAMRWFAEDRLERQGVKVHWDVADEEQRLPAAVEVTLFRVAQEAISNIARHASAQNAIITLEFTDHSVEMNFVDDGVGFDPASVLGDGAKVAALGIVGMRERVATLGGSMTLDSTPGGGTVLSVRVPIHFQEEAHA